jgi:hypothetical protein
MWKVPERVYSPKISLFLPEVVVLIPWTNKLQLCVGETNDVVIGWQARTNPSDDRIGNRTDANAKRVNRAVDFDGCVSSIEALE